MNITLFFVGILEMVIITAWTKVVTKTQVLASGAITFINILIWYYVLETVVKDINNVYLILLYALGCTIGTMLSAYFFRIKEKNAARKENENQLKKVF